MTFDAETLAGRLRVELPSEVHDAIPAFITLLQEAVSQSGPEDGAVRVTSMVDPVVWQRLAGRTVQTGSHLIDFGVNNQFGDISIGDVVAGDKVTLQITLSSDRPEKLDDGGWQAIEARWAQWLDASRSGFVTVNDLQLAAEDWLPAELGSHWNQFLLAVPWHERVDTIGQEISQSAALLPELKPLATALQAIRLRRTCESIAEEIRRLPFDVVRVKLERRLARLELATRSRADAARRYTQEEYEAVRMIRTTLRRLTDLAILGSATEPPVSFGRCLLVLAELGAGRSHLLAHLMAQGAANLRRSPADRSPVERYLFLPVALHAGAPPEEQVLTALRSASGFRWAQLSDLDDALHACMVRQEYRLIVAIDNLEDWFEQRPAGRTELVELIARTTDCMRLRWLLTHDLRRYLSLGQHRSPGVSFWRRYGWAPDAPARPAPDAVWFPLHDLNNDAGTGLTVLRRHWGREGDGRRLPLDFSPHHRLRSDLASPLIAWVVIGAGLRPEQLVNLHFVDFFRIFWERRWQVIERVAPESGALVLAAIQAVTELLFESTDLVVPEAPVIERIMTLTSSERQRAQAAIALLERAYLLQGPDRTPDWVSATGRLSFSAPPRVLRVLFPPFWAYSLADALARRAAESTDAELAGLNWATTHRASPLQSSVLELYTLMISQVGPPFSGNPVARLERLIMQAVSDEYLPRAALWLASSRLGTSDLQRVIAHHSMDLSVATQDAEALFGMLHFIGTALPDVLSLPERIRLVQPHVAALGASGLGRYVLYVVERLLWDCDSAALIAACLPLLHGCEPLDVTQDLAEACVTALADRLEAQARSAPQRWTAELRDYTLDFLLRTAEQVLAEGALGSTGGQWTRYYWREWVMRSVCRIIVKALGPEAYDLLQLRHWHRAEAEGLPFPITAELRREANLALGYWYHVAPSAERGRFFALLDRLLISTDIRDRRTAFYLIRHTRDTEGRRAVRVDAAFSAQLRRIYRDPDLTKLSARYRGTFAMTLPDFARIERQRRAALQRRWRRQRSMAHQTRSGDIVDQEPDRETSPDGG